MFVKSYLLGADFLYKGKFLQVAFAFFTEEGRAKGLKFQLILLSIRQHLHKQLNNLFGWRQTKLWPNNKRFACVLGASETRGGLNN